MDRFWLLTWTTYGTWLPGDERGFVSNVAGKDGVGKRWNQPQTPYAEKIRGLESHAISRISGEPIFLSSEMAVAVKEQFEETAGVRRWEIQAGAVMRNHVHLVVGVLGDPAPETLLQSFKSYASRRLNRRFSPPKSGTWWTESGSRRILASEESITAAVRYVRDQEFPLQVWLHPSWTRELGEFSHPGERGT